MQHSAAIIPDIVVIVKDRIRVDKCAVCHIACRRDIKFTDNLTLILSGKFMQAVGSVLRMGSCYHLINRLVTLIHMNGCRHFRILCRQPFCRSLYGIIANNPFLFRNIFPFHIHGERVVFYIRTCYKLFGKNWLIALNRINGIRRCNRLWLCFFVNQCYHIVSSIFFHFRYRHSTC